MAALSHAEHVPRMFPAAEMYMSSGRYIAPNLSNCGSTPTPTPQRKAPEPDMRDDGTTCPCGQDVGTGKHKTEMG